MEGFYQSFYDILESIEDSLKSRRIVPCLILLYSAIDSFSYLAERDGRKGKSVFKDWTLKWMLNKYPLPCDQNDIYSARCALLHNQFSESDLSKKKEARQIFYAWGDSEIKFLEKAIETYGITNSTVVVKVEDLIMAFRNGIADCLFAIEQDKGWMASFEERAQKTLIIVTLPNQS